VLPEHEILVEGETVAGRYQVEVARWMGEKWVPTMPSLYMLITDQRIILQPQTRKKYEPASIPGRYIRSVESLKTTRQGITLTLKNDQRIHLFVPTTHSHIVIEHIRAIATLPVSRTYHLPLTLNHLQKLISFVETM
jgi:hypothetical protein